MCTTKNLQATFLLKVLILGVLYIYIICLIQNATVTTLYYLHFELQLVLFQLIYLHTEMQLVLSFLPALHFDTYGQLKVKIFHTFISLPCKHWYFLQNMLIYYVSGCGTVFFFSPV